MITQDDLLNLEIEARDRGADRVYLEKEKYLEALKIMREHKSHFVSAELRKEGIEHFLIGTFPFVCETKTGKELTATETELLHTELNKQRNEHNWKFAAHLSDGHVVDDYLTEKRPTAWRSLQADPPPEERQVLFKGNGPSFESIRSGYAVTEDSKLKVYLHDEGYRYDMLVDDDASKCQWMPIPK